METKAKKLNCLSSYEGLDRFSLGQFSELLRLTEESYCNLKLKCPDTGQHTVSIITRLIKLCVHNKEKRVRMEKGTL